MAGSSIADLVIGIATDLARLQISTDAAVKVVEGMSNRIDALAGKATAALGGIAAGMVSFAAAKSFEDSIESAITYAAELEHLAAKTGTTVESLGGLVAIAKLSHTSIEEVTKGLQVLSKNMVETAAGTGKAKDTFRSLHLSVTDATGKLKDADAFMVELAGTLTNLDSKSQMVGDAMKVMGRSGANLIPFLKDLNEYGLIYGKTTEAQAASAAQYERTLVRLELAKKALYRVIAMELLPVMQAIAEMFLDARTKSDSFAGVISKLAQEGKIREWATNAAIGIAMVIDGFRYVKAGFEMIGLALGVVANYFVESFKNIGTVIGVTSASLGDFAQLLTGIGMILSGQWALGAQVVAGAWERLSGGAGLIADRFKESYHSIINSGTEFNQGMGKIADNFGEAYASKFVTKLGEVTAAHKKTGDAGKVHADVVKKTLPDAYDALLNSLEKVQAKLGAEIDFMKLYGMETKATTVATTAAELESAKMGETLAKRAAGNAVLMAALLSRAMAEAAVTDAMIREHQVEKDRIDVTKEMNDEVWRAHAAAVAQEKGLIDSIATFGLSAEAVTQYAIAQLEARKAMLLLSDGNASLVIGLQATIDKLTTVASLQGQFEAMKNFNSAVLQAADGVAGLVRAFGDNGVAGAIDYARKSLKQFALDLIALAAKKFFIQLVASATGSAALANAATQAGAGTLAGEALGGGTAGYGVAGAAYEYGSAAYAGFMGYPAAAEGTAAYGAGASLAGVEGGLSATGWGVIIAAVIAIAAWADKHRDKENWEAQLGFGANARAYSTTGPFGAEGFNSIQGSDAFNRQFTAFFTATHAIDEALVTRLSAEQIARITTNLAGQYDTRANGQPSTFAFGGGGIGNEAWSQLTLEFLQKKYGTVFDEIDKTFANFIRSYSGDTAGLAKEITSFIALLDALDRSGVRGLDIEALRAFQQEGETIGQTFQRIMTGMAQFDDAFLSEGDKLARAQKNVTSVFADLGMAVPADAKEYYNLVHSLDLGTEAGRRAYVMLMSVAGQFLSVEAAAAKLDQTFTGLLGRLRPGWATSMAQGDLTASLGQLGGPFAGMSVDALLDYFTNNTAAFSSLDATTKELIIHILELADKLGANTQAVTAAAANPFANNPYYAGTQEGFAGSWMGATESLISAVNNAPGTWMQRLSNESLVLRGQHTAAWNRVAEMQQQFPAGQYENMPEYKGLMAFINKISERIWTGIPADVAKLATLTAQYGQDKSDKIFSLDKEFAPLRAAAANNAEALLLIEQEYGRRRAEILAGNDAATLDALQAARDKVNKFLDDLRYDQALSPLPLAARVAASGGDINALIAAAQGGDAEAMGNLPDAARRYLTLLRQQEGSGIGYTSEYDRITGALQALGVGPQIAISDPYRDYGPGPAFASAISDANLATGTDVADLQTAVEELTTLVSTGIQVTDADTANAVQSLADAIRARSNSGLLATTS